MGELIILKAFFFKTILLNISIVRLIRMIFNDFEMKNEGMDRMGFSFSSMLILLLSYYQCLQMSFGNIHQRLWYGGPSQEYLGLTPSKLGSWKRPWYAKKKHSKSFGLTRNFQPKKIKTLNNGCFERKMSPINISTKCQKLSKPYFNQSLR